MMKEDFRQKTPLCFSFIISNICRWRCLDCWLNSQSYSL